ncbi:FAD binding domain-containing protein [Rhizodiscina lignyota]|uniref:Delta(24)-sterol reductase n=1 Tax=Rhizodiscina lignyota TaxID=1504668 RepID=A0A9P4INZ9_9PEZI|nr:FAD binding domain-containing protein [Rhizodiscina lignyota]
MQTHRKAVAEIAATVRSHFERNESFRINHGSTNSTRQMARRGRTVDISALSNVLQVDTQKKTALVEPNVPMDRLVEATMKHNLIPPVVMEFPGITVGGGYAGTAGESSSFKHGFFNETMNSVEMVLASGDLITASNSEHSDLFHGAAGAVGSFGITTLVELQLIRAKKYVKATYHPVHAVPEALEKVKEMVQDPELDYVDGILFSKTHGAIITGQLTDDLPSASEIQRFSRANDPWYYLHVQDRTSQSPGKPIVEYIPTADYCFRYDRGGFWVGRSAFQYFNFPFNSFTRWWLDEFMHTRMLYRALHASGQSRKYVVQDLALPFSTAETFINYTDQSFGIWPLWLCPLRQSRLPTLHPHNPETEPDGKSLKPLINIGLWGWGPSNPREFIAKNRELEQKLRELGGMKWLYAQTYYGEDEFWQMFDRQWYEALREKYNAKSLPSVWNKVHVDVEAEEAAIAGSWSGWLKSVWPVSGIWGLYKAIQSGEYLIARRSTWKST